MKDKLFICQIKSAYNSSEKVLDKYTFHGWCLKIWGI